jgi:hypothetical protein
MHDGCLSEVATWLTSYLSQDLSNGVFMGDLAEEYSRRAIEAEINVVWACDPDLKFYWRQTASEYRRLAAEAIARRAIIDIAPSHAA